MNMIICSPDPGSAFAVDRELFEREVQKRFGPNLVTESETEPMDVIVRIERSGEPMFHINRSRDGDMVSTDGTPDQALEVALWIRSLLPDDPGGRIWMVDQGYSGHVELSPGMTADDVKAGWVEHGDSD